MDNVSVYMLCGLIHVILSTLFSVFILPHALPVYLRAELLIFLSLGCGLVWTCVMKLRDLNYHSIRCE